MAIRECGNGTGIPNDVWRFLQRIPALRYLKEPVDYVQDLYEKYRNGAERGSFAYVISKNTFYSWNIEKKIWEPTDTEFSQLFEKIPIELMNNGDVYVWDADDRQFKVANTSIWGLEEY